MKMCAFFFFRINNIIGVAEHADHVAYIFFQALHL